MGKLLFWIVVAFAILFAVRLIGAAQARKRRDRSAGTTPGGPMVRCSRCGVFLPRADAVESGGRFRCKDGECATTR
jgi:hypothetical protein